MCSAARTQVNAPRKAKVSRGCRTPRAHAAGLLTRVSSSRWEYLFLAFNKSAPLEVSGAVGGSFKELLREFSDRLAALRQRGTQAPAAPPTSPAPLNMEGLDARLPGAQWRLQGKESPSSSA